MNLALPEIRLAVRADASGIAAMSRDYIESGLAWSWTAARVLRSICDPCTNVAVLHETRALVGFGIMHYGDEVAHLALLAMRPELRNRGLGSRLMAWLEKPARVAGIGSIKLEARADNPRALEFYARAGYTSSGRICGYYQGLIDAVQLVKSLASAG